MEKHLFIALKLPEQVKEKLAEFCGKLEEHVSFKKWVHTEDYHITLAFLGKAEKEQLSKLYPSLKETVAGHKVFSLRINHFGFFGRDDHPRIFWSGVEREESLLELQQKVAENCLQAGFSLEKRPYTPHITLSRKLLESSELPIDQNAWWREFGEEISFQVEDVVVYETHFEKLPKYEIVQSFSLDNK
jgi:2'-5' RNA ligase